MLHAWNRIWNRMGLQKKTILPVVVLLLVGMLVIQWVVVSSVRRISYESFREAGDTLAKLMASNSSYAVEWEEMEDLERVLKGVEHYRDAVFVGVLRGQELLLGFERDEGGRFRKVSNLPAQEKKLKSFEAPIKSSDGETIGSVRLAFSTEGLRKQMRATTLRLQIFMLAVIALVAWIWTILTRKVVISPIEILQRAARSIAKGNLDVKLDITSGDELGSLADSMQDMAVQIKEALDTA
ncbi:MAG: hypothetical protein DRP95_05560, partial [Candidatus Latescibacterota bacterium]